jgi:uncharacterized protein (TIGR03435 family)
VSSPWPERFNIIQAEGENPQTTTEAVHNPKRKRAETTAAQIARNGPKLQQAKGDEVTLSFGAVLKPVPGLPVTLTARKYSIGMLAHLLSQIGPGAWDFQLSWDENAGPTLFTALQEQLGLKLEPRKVPVAYFVIDSAQRPGDN